MASDPVYPFGLPGMSHLGGSSQGNPLASSLELMRSAMSSFGQSASLAGGSMASSLNPEDLERKIAELKVVENWLRLNLSMLGSSIQGMEVQLATIKTLRSFVEMGSQNHSADERHPSPLEIVLGLKKASPDASRRPQTESPPAAPGDAPDSPWSGQSRQANQASPDTSSQAPSDASAKPAAPQSGTSPAQGDANTAAAKAWWDMLQNQFSQLAAATAQATRFSHGTGQDVDASQATPARSSAAKKAVTKRSAPGAETSRPKATKTGARKSSARKTSAGRPGKST